MPPGSFTEVPGACPVRYPSTSPFSRATPMLGTSTEPTSYAGSRASWASTGIASARTCTPRPPPK